MPFDDLSDDQQTFIRKYFKTGAFRSKTKEKYKDFNNRLQDALTPLYDQLNGIKTLLGRIADAEADLPEDAPHVPISLYENRIIAIEDAIKETLSQGRAMLKAGLVPDFAPVAKDLNELEARLNQQLERIHSGARATDLTDAEKLRAAKEQATSTTQDDLDAHLAATVQAYAVARDKTAAARLEHIKERNAKYMEYNTAYHDGCRALVALLDAEGADTDVDLPTYTARCTQVLSDFTRVADPLRARIIALGDEDPLTQEELSARKAEEPFKAVDTVKISEARAAGIAEALSKLQDTKADDGTDVPGAITVQTAKLTDLKDAYSAADEAARGGILKKIRAQEAQVAKLESRAQQLEAYAAQELNRDRQIIASIEAGQQASADAQALSAALDADEDTDLAGFDFAWLDGPDSGMDGAALLAMIEAYKVVVDASKARDLIVQKLSPEEPTPKEISEQEANTLTAMLENAAKLLDEGRVDIAEKLYNEVMRLRREFMAARQALQLPPTAPPAPTQVERLIKQLEVIRSDANDLWGQGVAEASDAATDAADLIEQIKADDKAGAFVEAPDLHEGTVDGLRARVDGMVASAAPTPIAAEKVAAAQDTANQISAFLDGALKTKPLKETDIVREPGRVYPAQTEKHLVEREDLIMVLEEGALVQHKIESSVKKGGVDTASTQRGNKIPVEVLEAMVARNHALRAMAEADTPGAEAMLEAYQTETENWFKDVSENGAALYPELAKLIADCDAIIKKKEVATYIPKDFPAFLEKYETFKAGYLKKTPTQAQREGEPLKTELEAFNTTAKDVVKPAYEAAKATYEALLASLTGKDKKGAPPTLGKLMEEFMSQKPEEVFGDVSDLTEQGAADVAKARANFVTLQEHFKKANTVSPKTIEGPWLNDAKAAMQLADTKMQENIEDAADKLAKIDGDVKTYIVQMNAMSAATGDDLAKRLNQLCSDIYDNAVAATNAHNKGFHFVKAIKALKEDVAATVKALKKLGKNPIAQDLKMQADGLEARCKAAGTKAAADKDFDSGMAEVEKITGELATIKSNMSDLDPSSRVKVKTYRIGDRLKTLETVLGTFTARSAELASKTITPQMSDTQKAALAQDVSIIDVSLKKNTNVISIAALKSISDEIDTKNDDPEKSWKVERMKLREQALKEMRTIRAKLETHPSAQLYASNPFDGGTNMRLVLSALQHVEIAILACVSPKDPD